MNAGNTGCEDDMRMCADMRRSVKNRMTESRTENRAGNIASASEVMTETKREMEMEIKMKIESELEKESGTRQASAGQALQSGIRCANMEDMLQKMEYLEASIRCGMEQMQHLKLQATRVTSVLSDVKVTNGYRHDALESAVVRLVDLEREIAEDIRCLIEMQRKIGRRLERLGPQSQTVMRMRYLCRKSWKEIADQMDCSLANVYRIHRKALSELQDMEDEEANREQQVIGA